MIEYLLPLLEASGASAGGLGGSAGLLNALGGGGVFGKVAGSTMDGGMQGPTQGSGLFGALSGGGMDSLLSPKAIQTGLMTKGLFGNEKQTAAPGYQFSQNRFRPTNY